MRILLFFVILGLFFLFSYPVKAAEECSGVVNVTTEFQKGLPAQSIWELKSGMNWSWLTFDFDSRLTPQNYYIVNLSTQDEVSSGITAVFGTPYLKNLDFKTTAWWKKTYSKVSNALTYDWRLFKRLNGKLSYEEGVREATSEGEDKDNYDWDKGTLSLGLDYNFISYDLDYSRGNYNYPQADDCSYIKETLTHKVHLRTEQSDLTLTYYETTGDFPYDLDYTKSYWRERWDLKIKQEFSKVWRCTLAYGQMQSEKGFKPYLDSKSINTEIFFKPAKNQEISIQTVFNDIDKSQDPFDLPGDLEEEISQTSEDTLSHTEQKISLTYRIDLGRFSGDLGFYSELDDYDEDQKDKMKSGFNVTFHYKMQPTDIVLKIAPQGDLTQSLGFYQLTLQYKL